MADRVRMSTLALATTALAQSPSFWHAGADLLRSKSLDRNSYNSGDWFNRIDWSANESTWGSGLPPTRGQRVQVGLHAPAARRSGAEAGPGRPAGGAGAGGRAAAHPLLVAPVPARQRRLVQERVSFPTGGPGQTPGVIVMAIEGRRESIVVVFNATPDPTTQTVASLAGRRYTLHPVQASGGDPVVRGASASGGAFTVPGRTVAVFVSERGRGR